MQFTEFSNTPDKIKRLMGRNLHNQEGHPIWILKTLIYHFFDEEYRKLDNLSPIVPIENNFDRLCVPKDHPSRKKTDTYYVSETHVLRSHMTAHTAQRLSDGESYFLSCGDVYRKDETDRCHYPVFHQIDGVGRVPNGTDPSEELLSILSGLTEWLFPGQEYRVNPDYFPFTEPSYEIEVFHNGEWLEILGGGILHDEITGVDEKFWAFGIGLERLAMILFEIPDIRLFWSQHPRFLDQFNTVKTDLNFKPAKFKPFSDLPNQKKDISFWIPEDQLTTQSVDGTTSATADKEGDVIWTGENDFNEIIRHEAGDLVEYVKLMDEFYHKKKRKHSRMYTIMYSPIDPDMNNPAEFTELVNTIQMRIADRVGELNVEIR
jgi:phenylalanyl-tRNA synthetase alpha chain